ncbi:MAG: hypothetical protein P1U38_09450 [Aeromicrobium sp.]|uniref:hypothetical protein n=1 Tax=Aeromicrobium sp. TaxID=1871063 RepID=UPI0025BB02E0|nr:hypothetical protein [Aeromicrobium sp.]MCK5890400.1 hypothetical protein [Aeromicrobium sp.]MDF1704987.1 hypothetical protein [Aeromicrobium sp.]
MSLPESSVYRLGRGPALVATGVLTIATGVLVFAAFLMADDATPRLIGAVVLGVLAAASVLLAARFALRPPSVIRLDATGFTVARPRVRAAWKQVDDVALDSAGFLVLTGEGTARVELRLLDPDARQVLVREVYDRLNTAHGYTRFG